MSASRPPLHDSYEDLHDRAQSMVRAGNVDGAITLYRRLVTKLGHLSDRILARRPELREMHQQARTELAGLLHSLGRYGEAIEVEEVLLSSHPEEAAMWRTDIAIMRIAKGEAEKGLAELRLLAEDDPNTTARWLVLASESRIEGRFSESQAALERALETAQDDDKALAQAHYLRFLLLKEMNQLDEAVGAWEQAARLDAQASRTVRQVYTMLTDVGRYGSALRYVDRDENALQAGYQRGIIASLTGNLGKARQEWQRVAGMNAADFEYGHDAWVEAVLRLGDPDPALEWLQQYLPQFGSPRLLILSGIGWAMRQDGELAAKLFQQAIDFLQRGRPPKQKLDSTDWRLLDSLVTDDELKAGLKRYFAVVETLWG
jgi:tetratricopeptide (TPR) repeat protein